MLQTPGYAGSVAQVRLYITFYQFPVPIFALYQFRKILRSYQEKELDHFVQFLLFWTLLFKQELLNKLIQN